MKLVSFGLEVSAQLYEIVDLSVEHHGQRSGVIAERLLSSCEIDDAKAPEGECDWTVGKQPFLIGSAVNERRTHASGHTGIFQRSPSQIQQAGNSAHTR